MDRRKAEMEREELIRHLEEAVKKEETATQIYIRHLSAIVSRSGLRAEDVSRIRKSFQYLVEENDKHAAQLLSLIDRVRKEGTDV
jgi:rubrerythrin